MNLNYQYYLKHHKKERKVKKNTTYSDPLFTISSCDLSDIDLNSKITKEEVPSMFSKEYLETYKNKMDQEFSD